MSRNIDVRKTINDSNIENVLAKKFSEIFNIDEDKVLEHIRQKIDQKLNETGRAFHENKKDIGSVLENISPDNFNSKDIKLIKDE